jgi:5-methylcytosine-specific restriction enzyme A
MPMRPRVACNVPGCLLTTTRRSGRCAGHERAFRAAVDQERGSAAKRGYGRTWQAVRSKVLVRHPRCQWGSLARDGVPLGWCRERSTDAAHIIPRSERGTDSLDNLRGLCHAHHSAETSARESWNAPTRERSR